MLLLGEFIYPFDILWIFLVVDGIAFDDPVCDNLLNPSLTVDCWEAHGLVLRRLGQDGRLKEPNRQLKKLP